MPVYRDGELWIGAVSAAQLVARFGSPLYVYDAEFLRRRGRHLQTTLASLNPHFHYSVKANGNLTLLSLLKNMGFGFDIVSGGELARVMAVDAPSHEISFAGVGKSRSELEAALVHGIGFFNVESAGELHQLAALAAEHNLKANVLLRLNPNIDPKTHHYITTGRAINKFGLTRQAALQLVEQYCQHQWLSIVGIHMHLGSQITQIAPYVEAAKVGVAFIQRIRQLRDCQSEQMYLNLGGGFGISYEAHETREVPAFDLAQLAAALKPLLTPAGVKLILEPGRSLVASAGLLLTRVTYLKDGADKKFAVVDTGMHHMIRPALYQGWHRIWPTRPTSDAPSEIYDVVGPICESADFLAKDRALPPISPGDVLALFDAGAYGMVMASNYNAQPRPAEVLVEGSAARLIRRRETYADLLRPEQDLL